MADRGFKMRIAFAALEDIKNTFFSQFTPQERDYAISYGLNDKFLKVTSMISLLCRSRSRGSNSSILRKPINSLRSRRTSKPLKV